MIQSFRHKGLRLFFETGKTTGIQPSLSPKLRLQLAALQSANQIEDLECPGYRLHLLKGTDKGRWSIWVNGNWRLTFEFREGHVFNLDFEDYH
ncbi:type II toxin-antitoxin system RelE/ParE family toxin [Cyanobium sp. HWJ4-Hawea]|uniref:type II toxin-antitoxin system RelE/ParE family toxin n=1 Tax=Cyanobium sp. HWJ4-Hawea TaxID=2823713 RepID=UPI0020CE84CF|nr:type II toxin-antitoxin system RelE/ParE family toxin [Cyanobium sp. HWJ4-Hawea]MCP9808464.1 type II toxin-antitoxin system RelE/ParE family toxin [Cyanobium sp. HWJ4-Hawea]